AAHPMLPHVGQGANQAIEDGVALATILAHFDSASAPEALQLYERVRREHTTRVQGSSRNNGRRYDADASAADLSARDQQLSNQARDRAWMWDADAEASAIAAITSA
ncbi:MAG TPA: FAD-dependent monooxygenase, partial [Chloroflexota bacterium]